MTTPNTNWTVGAMKSDDAFGPRRYWHEDGYYWDYSDAAIVISYNEYGNEYVLGHTFPDIIAAENFVKKIKVHLAAGGDLNLDHWNFNRVVYGSQAYLDEEPYIVEREKQDALDREAWGG
jgi:hypothetical protein